MKVQLFLIEGSGVGSENIFEKNLVNNLRGCQDNINKFLNKKNIEVKHVVQSSISLSGTKSHTILSIFYENKPPKKRGSSSPSP